MITSSKLVSIFYIDNLRAVGEFSSVKDLILVAHKLTLRFVRAVFDKPQVFLFLQDQFQRIFSDVKLLYIKTNSAEVQVPVY